MRDFRELAVWQKAHRLVLEEIRRFDPDEHRGGLWTKMLTALHRKLTADS